MIGRYSVLDVYKLDVFLVVSTHVITLFGWSLLVVLVLISQFFRGERDVL